MFLNRLRTRPILAAALAAVLFGGPAAAPLRADEPSSLRQDLGQPVGQFTLTQRDGTPFTAEQLRGKIWIAHFFYPACQGPCTRTVPTMAKVQDALRGKSDYVLVSIALNNDTPELLQGFANDHGADEKQWLFLTGPMQQVHEIVQRCFFQTAMKKELLRPGDEIDHTTNLMVIDRQGMIRGYIDGQDPAVVPMVVKRLRELAAPRYLQPAGNAALNALCTVLLLLGWIAIKQGRETLHKACMLLALAASVVFLASYLYFHFVVLDGQPTRFPGQGLVRPIYFAVLLTHTVLAAAVAPLALYVAYQGLRDRRPRHVRVARWTLPIWLYVSITGVVVYVLLYQVFPPY